MMLTEPQRRWLQLEAKETLGLTTVRTRILTAVLDRLAPFSMRGIGRETGQSAENVRLALDLMVARELIELLTLADPHRPKASFQAQAGRRLQMILATLESTPPVGESAGTGPT